MPRGVYDRSKLKAKRAAAQPAHGASKTTKPVSHSAGSYGAGQSTGITASGSGSSVLDLHTHLVQLTQTRVQLSGQNIAHNQQLLTTIDAELAATISSLRSWRQSRFPEDAKAERTAELGQGPQAMSEAQVPQPQQPQAQTAPAPLPFTPANVQGHMSGSQA